ncbi:MAG: hypothetical protein ACLP8S_13795 [Solirubrobacteraceae bacterium]
MIIVGGNIENHDQTLASAVVSQLNDFDNVPDALAIGIVLLALIILLIGALTLLQQRSGPINLRFRTR